MTCEISAVPRHDQEADLERRFAGIARLYGRRALNAFQGSHICVAGIGGVGSWVAEALARSALGALTLIDLDHVSESNVNRQIHALEPEFGKAKTLAMRERIAQINPACRVHLIDDFVTPDNVATLVAPAELDFVIDCVDQYLAKAALIAHCRRRRLPVVTVGGIGGQCDPGRIRVADLSRSVHDPLLAKTRRHLRREHGFRRSGPMGVLCVYSTEQARYPQPDGEVGFERAAPVEASLHCGGYGSATHLTGSFAFAAVARVLADLAKRASEAASQPEAAAV